MGKSICKALLSFCVPLDGKVSPEVACNKCCGLEECWWLEEKNICDDVNSEGVVFS